MNKQIVLQKIDNLSSGRKLCIVLISILMLAALYWFFFLQNSWQQSTDLRDSITRLEQDIAIYRKKASQLPELEKTLEANQKELLYAQSLLPESMHDVENLLAEIEKLGNELGVEFQLFEPGQEEIQDFYVTQMVNLRVKGQFHNLLQFFSQMSRLNRLVTLENLKLQPDGSQTGQDIVLSAPAQIAVYRALTQLETQAQEARGK